MPDRLVYSPADVAKALKPFVGSLPGAWGRG